MQRCRDAEGQRGREAERQRQIETPKDLSRIPSASASYIRDTFLPRPLPGNLLAPSQELTRIRCITFRGGLWTIELVYLSQQQECNNNNNYNNNNKENNKDRVSSGMSSGMLP